MNTRNHGHIVAKKKTTKQAFISPRVVDLYIVWFGVNRIMSYINFLACRKETI